MTQNDYNLKDDCGCIVVTGGTLYEKQLCLSDIFSGRTKTFDCAMAQSRHDRLFEAFYGTTDDENDAVDWPIVPNVFRYDRFDANSVASLLRRQKNLFEKKQKCSAVFILDDMDVATTVATRDLLKEISLYCAELEILFVLFVQPEEARQFANLLKPNALVYLEKKEIVQVDDNNQAAVAQPYVLPESVNSQLRLGGEAYWRFANRVEHKT